MDQKAAMRIMEVQQIAANTAEYRELLREYRVMEPQMLTLLEELPDDQRDVLMDFLGLWGEMFRKLLEVACR